jgi:hypothetical protein
MASTSLLALSVGALLAFAVGIVSAADKPDLRFDRTISREVLENYLSRSITMMDLCTGKGDVDDNIRMLKNIGARYAGRTLYMWGNEKALDERLKKAREIIPKIRAALPDLILQGCVFEIVTRQVDSVPVPERVFKEFGLPVERRNFRYEAMLFDKNLFHNKWGKESSVPDITKLETQMWFYYVATAYIEVGMEGIHYGQVALIGRNDPKHQHWWEVLSRARKFASEHARRHIVLCDAHTPDGGPIVDGKLLFDFHAFPLRIKEVAGQPQKGILEKGFHDSLFGRSKGGITASGWTCESLPFLVELDNWGSSGKAGQPGVPYHTWGYDEIDWFAHQPEAYRNEWLRYAAKWVRENDPNGFFQMPGSRCLHDPIGKQWWYYAQMKTTFPEGFNQEDTIKDVWAQ